MTWLSSDPLNGGFVTLEPLGDQHIEALKEAVLEGEPWTLWFANVPSPESMEKYVHKAMQNAVKGYIAYAVKLNKTHQIIGTTRFYNVEAKNKRVMLGFTWYAASARRTPVNTECKLLLLKHLFDKHSAIAVEFRTHVFNHTSRKAIERLGAKQNGILRHHQMLADGSIRDTVVYSIISSEWPAVSNHLHSKLY
ncbi:GNAT family N-acetyltransferase [Shewanella surugensis]|uniref:GNAT family N-acetyltransferase n=1 Tax=Shewanella surugensis TaxID=212020 RepID=A0ABT0LHU3_9GAMM|nr:GNAT family protein [Shewanella surugensis]MCL1127259.1 GNAT family N-acetyltransferase [Shewanella surugensis]